MDYRFENVNESENENQGYQPQYSYQPQPDTAPEAPQKPKKNRTGAKVTALVLSCALVGGAMGFGGSALQNHLAAKNADTEEAQQASVVYEGSRETSVINIAQIDTSKEMTPAEVYAQNVNSTVGIRTSITTNYWGYQTQAAAAGSGFILSADGYILTNYHVVEDSNSITVSLYDGTEYDATLVGCDESNDIAVLKIDAEGLTPVVLGDSDNLNVGDQVVAIGNPLGELTFSLTTGVVSALNREVTLSSNVTMNLIQTDCAINSGNSGGPLFNNHGEVIGIVSAKYSSASSSSSSTSVEGLGFAIPMDDVADMVSQLVSNGYVSGQPILGVSVNRNEISQEAQAYGVPAGAEILVVTPGLCGEEAGLQAGDIVTQINDTTVSNGSDLINAVANYSPGDTVTLTVYRNGETLTLQVTLDESTPETEAQQEQAQQSYKEQQQQQSQTQQQGSSWPFGNYGY